MDDDFVFDKRTNIEVALKRLEENNLDIIGGHLNNYASVGGLKGTVKYSIQRILHYENEHLLVKYPEHRALVNEFHDGMLLYEINSEKVWNAAIKDSVGLENFYETIKTEYPVETPNDTLQYKPFSEIRAAVVSRYQDYLEANWRKELRAKYPVFVDEKVFKSLFTK